MFNIINNQSEINLNNKWVPATKFNSKDRIVDQNGHKIGSGYKDRQYRIIEKRERAFSSLERFGRSLLGTVIVICTLCFVLFSKVICALCFVLFSKSVRNLFTKSKENIRFAVLETPVNLSSKKDHSLEYNISEQELQQGISIREISAKKTYDPDDKYMDSSQLIKETKILDYDFLVLKVEATQIYSGLGANWWKQIFDGKYHHLGEKVFDEGLHNPSIKEPGFCASALNAYNFAKDHLCEPLTIDFYLELHKIACAHFQGIKNCTQMEAGEAGKFRDSSKYQEARMPVDGLLIWCIEDSSKPINHKDVHDWIYNIYASSDKMTVDWARSNNPQTTLTIEKIKILTELKDKSLIKLNEYLNELQKDPIFGPYVPRVVKMGPDKLNFIYYKGDDIPQIINKLFTKFNLQISDLNHQIKLGGTQKQLNNEKLRLIADLFQKLEWLHPFEDGQGRTDLILLGKLLSEHGFNPSTLYEPYLSSYVPLDGGWCQYLNRGMEEWRKLKSSL